MKSNKKFPPALGAIVEQALKDNTAWIGKTVLELTCEAIKKQGLSQENVEGCVCLPIEEAKILAELFDEENVRKGSIVDIYITRFVNRIKQAEMSIAST